MRSGSPAAEVITRRTRCDDRSVDFLLVRLAASRERCAHLRRSSAMAVEGKAPHLAAALPLFSCCSAGISCNCPRCEPVCTARAPDPGTAVCDGVTWSLRTTCRRPSGHLLPVLRCTVETINAPPPPRGSPRDRDDGTRSSRARASAQPLSGFIVLFTVCACERERYRSPAVSPRLTYGTLLLFYYFFVIIDLVSI